MAHTSDMDLKVKVEIDASSLGKVIADAIEEHMALPACDREHVEPMAEWEKDLLHAVTFPRVVKDRSEFQVGQIIALTITGAEAMAEVTHANEGCIKLDGRYLRNGNPIAGIFQSEIEKGYWLILSAPEGRR